MESMQSILPPTVTPGWNDPPNLGGAAAPTASNRLSHLRKRLVDPSISSVSPSSGMMPHQAPDQEYIHRTDSANQQAHPHGHGGHAASQQYGVVPTPVSVGIPTSAPIPGVTTTQATTQAHMQPQQQYTHHLAPIHSVPMTSAYQLPQTAITPDHLPQQPQQQQYPTAAFHAYSQGMPAAQHNQMSADGAVQPQQIDQQNVQLASNQQFFQQQHYHGAPPIHRT
ncbi:hypothetical protein RB195_008325 [Necator americanus]|uniref:Uncharacterized protein n=1 Tax=Necator americanus TaxID=51031 RepID=A0ABR1CQ03_NECAM